MRAYKNDKNSNFRVAVVISKKTAKLAVTRNLIRRRIYEIIRKNQHQINGSYDIVFTVFSENISTIPSTDLESQILKLLKASKAISQ